MSRATAKRVQAPLWFVGWLPYRLRGQRMALNNGGLRWRWLSLWSDLALAWGRAWNRHLASDEERV